MGVAAIALWSTAVSTTFWGTNRMGVWQFLTLACGIGGILQIAAYRLMGRSVRSIFLPPPRLWLVTLLGFVLYLLVYSQALASSATQTQAVCVGLINHLWPTLTVLFSVLLVPGTVMTRRLGLACLMAMSGPVLADWGEVRNLFVAGAADASAASVPVWPYLLAALAAVLWAGYSAYLARWRAWADRYATAPVGFLVTAILSGAACRLTGQWRQLDGQDWAMVCFAGLGPYAAGYMFWELALHRAPAKVLGLLAAVTPVLSTLCLFLLFSFSGMKVSGQTQYPTVLAGAVLVGSAVVLGLLPGRTSPLPAGEASRPSR